MNAPAHQRHARSDTSPRRPARRDGELLASLTPRATVLSPDRAHSVTFDREGRWLFYFAQGRTYKRSLGSEVHLRFRRKVRQRRRLPAREARRIFEEVHALARQVHAISAGEIRRRLGEEILLWTPERLQAEATRFQLAYRPIPILPPDQYRAIVLQATEGCTWNQCTFCNFYMDRPFRVRTPAEFAVHVDAVRELLGEGIRLRSDVFLADGNALALANRRLLPLLRIAQHSFPGRKINGFVDLFSGERKSLAQWRALRGQGLQRIHVGMETAVDELLAFVNKPGSALELREFVGLLKQADLQISLIVMIGLGGREFRHRHARASQQLLLGLPLDSLDQVYLSPFVEHAGSQYELRRREAGLTAMTEREVEEDMAEMASRLRAGGLRVGRYDIREFIY